MTQTDLQLEKFYRDVVAKRPKRKFEETNTYWDRRIFWYDRDELSRQADLADKQQPSTRITYEDHRKVIEIAINMLHANTQHEIAMQILTHRFFKNYRAKVFAGEGSFRTDYSFLLRKIAMLFNPNTSSIRPISVSSQLNKFTTPTLVQINHIVGEVTVVHPPGNKFTLNEWASIYNMGAPESTSYRLVGLKL